MLKLKANDQLHCKFFPLHDLNHSYFHFRLFYLY